MQVDMKTLVKFAQHLRAHLNEPTLIVNEETVQFAELRVHAFSEDYVFDVTRTINRNDEARQMQVEITAKAKFVLHVEMVERDGKYVDTFTLAQEGDAEILKQEDVAPIEKTESQELVEALPQITPDYDNDPNVSPGGIILS